MIRRRFFHAIASVFLGGLLVRPKPSKVLVYRIEDAPPAWIRIPFFEIEKGKRYALKGDESSKPIVFLAASDAYVNSEGRWEVSALVEGD